MPQYLILLITALVSFAISLLIGPPVIKILRQLKFGQSIREDGPRTHLKKAGTPTMGGILILISLISGLFAARCFSGEVLWVLFLTVGFGLIGLVDDLIIIITKRSLGLKARQKLFAQIVLAALAAAFLLQRPTYAILPVPYANFQITVAAPLFFLFVVFILVAASNAVNLTDGLDGLAAGTSGIAVIALGILCAFQGQGSLAIFSFALAGACFGFIWFNGPPAQVFMGDTGSLALGAALGGLTVFSRTELFLPIIGGVFVAETLSVIIQVISFKTYGKRVFRMSPLHHHFELGGMLEPQIVLRFWLVGAILGIIGILGFLFK